MNCRKAGGGRGRASKLPFVLKRVSVPFSAFDLITIHDLCGKNQCRGTETIYCLQWTIKAAGQELASLRYQWCSWDFSEVRTIFSPKSEVRNGK